MSKEADRIVKYLIKVATPSAEAMPFIECWDGEDNKTKFVRADGGYLDAWAFNSEAAEVIDAEIDKIKHDAEMQIKSAIKDAKIEAYELALTHTRPMERIREDKE